MGPLGEIRQQLAESYRHDTQPLGDLHGPLNYGTGLTPNGLENSRPMPKLGVTLAFQLTLPSS